MEKPNGVWPRLVRDLDLHAAMLFLATLIGVTVLGVFMRYCLNRPITWLEEAQLGCFVWIIFLGVCGVARKTGHIAIDAFVGLFPAFMRRAADGVTHLAIMAVLGFLGYYSVVFVQQMYASDRATNILFIPYWLIYGVVPPACLYMVYNSFLALIGKRRPQPAAYVKEPENV